MHACLYIGGVSRTANSPEDSIRAKLASKGPVMAEENVEYDLLEDIGEEVDYDDFTLEDEDYGKQLFHT